MFKSIDSTTFNAQVLQAKGLVMVNFGAPSCGACDLLDIVLKDLKADLGNTVKIVKVNVDTEVQLADQQRILILPTLKIFKNGECVKDVFGVQPKDDLKAVIKTLSDR